jgi:hypothetical protein
MAAFPFARACYRVEVDYNEGWNVYNAALIADHYWLYPVRYGWTSVNYPMLWFVILAQMHRVTHEYLFTARALSLVGLVGCCLLVGAIVRRLGGSRRVSWLAGLFCLALFSTDADQYVGMADPQIFAQMFFLAGLWVYLWRRSSLAVLAGVALLFVLGGSIKHNPIDVPLAVLVELVLVSPRRAVWFSACGLVFAGVSVALNTHFGGAYFVAQLLAPREYSVAKAFRQTFTVMGPLLLPLCAAVSMAFVLRKDKERRIAGILLATSLPIGMYFNGGSGVSVNAFFSAFLAIAILCGLFFEEVRLGRLNWGTKRNVAYVPLMFFGWLIIPWLLVPKIDTGDWNPARKLAETRASEERFTQEIALLEAKKGPVICESLLLCFFAGKPYIYDPFNATRLIHLDKLNPQPMLDDLSNQRYAAVQLDEPIEQERHSERFDPAIVIAIEEAYQASFVSEDGEILLPRVRSK